MSQVKLGRAAELLFQAECLIADLECFCPSTEDGKVDLIVGPHRYRCQVKVMGFAVPWSDTRHLPLTKRRGPKGSKARFRYSDQEVDFMVGVRLDTGAMYIVPIESTSAWTTRVSESALVRMETRDAFHLLRAAPGDAVMRVAPRQVVGARPQRRIPLQDVPLVFDFLRQA